MTRTERTLREGAQADKAADEGRHDEAAELRAAMEELKPKEGAA